MSIPSIIKRAHLYIFLFGEFLFASNPLFVSIHTNIRRLIIIAGLGYAFFYFERLPRPLKNMASLYFILAIILVGVSYQKYGVAIESLQYMSITFYPSVVFGGFVSAWLLREISIKEIVNAILILFIFNQIILGKIFNHQFNASDRSTSSEETYLLMFTFCFFLIKSLQENNRKNTLATIMIFMLLIGFFHRTVWVTTVASLLIIGYLHKDKVTQKISKAFVTILPLGIISSVALALLLSVKNDLANNFMSSLDDIENSNSRGTAGWRHDQRELYLSRIYERPFFGWMYDGYDDGELTANVEENANWVDTKGTFIHSGYINVFYHNGLLGFMSTYGSIVGTLLFMWRRRRSDPGYMALFTFLLTGFIFSWSYQLPLFYWVLVGIGSYMACLVPVEKESTSYRAITLESGPTHNNLIPTN